LKKLFDKIISATEELEKTKLNEINNKKIFFRDSLSEIIGSKEIHLKYPFSLKYFEEGEHNIRIAFNTEKYNKLNKIISELEGTHLETAIISEIIYFEVSPARFDYIQFERIEPNTYCIYLDGLNELLLNLIRNIEDFTFSTLANNFEVKYLKDEYTLLKNKARRIIRNVLLFDDFIFYEKTINFLKEHKNIWFNENDLKRIIRKFVYPIESFPARNR